MTEAVRRTTLGDGLRVVTEHLPATRSAAIGVWVGAGSRHESPAEHGCSHFLEHVLFKGTPTRTAFEISRSLEAVGGEFNAYTAKDHTCFHAAVLDEDLPLAVDVLGDMMSNSLVTDADVDAEREVILDEIAMHADDPDDVAHNLLAETMWGADTPMGRPIAGTGGSIAGMPRDVIDAYWRRHYTPGNVVIAVAGNVQHDAAVEQIEKAFSLHPSSEPGPAAEPPQVAPPDAVRATRPTEQVTTLIAVPGLARGDERRYAMSVLNIALGGGQSSRLFQEVREKRGLAYSVYSFAGSYADAGMWGVAAGSLPGRVDPLVETVRAELAAVAAGGFTAEELELGKGQLRGGLVLGLEDSGSRMSRLGRSALFDEDLPTIDELIERVDAVTLDEVHALAADLLSGPEFHVTVGPEAAEAPR